MQACGAVSEETVIEMVKGAIDTLGLIMPWLHRALPDRVEVLPRSLSVPFGWQPGGKDKIMTLKLTEDEGRDKNIQFATKNVLQLLLSICQNKENEQ